MIIFVYRSICTYVYIPHWGYQLFHISLGYFISVLHTYDAWEENTTG